MGKRGPQRTPTETLKLRGSWLAKTRKNEPKAAGRPICPVWMCDDAKLIWEQVIPELADMGVLGKIDGIVLARYCELWVRWKDANKYIHDNGEVYRSTDDAGKEQYCQQRPEVGILNKLGAELLKIEQHFGMTPGSRASLTVDKPAEAKPTGKGRHFGNATG